MCCAVQVDEEEAVLLVEPRHVGQLLHPTFVAPPEAYQKHVIAT